MTLPESVPILGTIVLLGVIVQIALGFQVAADVQGLLVFHMAIGFLGFVFALALTVLAFRARAGTVYSKITMTVLGIIALLQVFLGFEHIQGADALLVSHEAGAFLILGLALVTAGVTFWSGTRKPQLKV
jgi:hypothetical protein